MRMTIHKKQRMFVAALALAAMCVSCRPRTIEEYQKDGIQFKHYSDWKVIKDAPVDGNAKVRAIQVESPEHAVVSVICVPPTSSQTLDQFTAVVADKRAAAIDKKFTVGSFKASETDKGTSEPNTDTVAGRERQGILQNFSIDLLGVEVPHEARFFMLKGSRYKVIVMSQFAIKYADKVRPESELILSSLSVEGLQE